MDDKNNKSESESNEKTENKNDFSKSESNKPKDYISVKRKYIFAVFGIIIIVASLFLINGSLITGNAVKKSGSGDILAEFNGNKIYSDQFNKEFDLILFFQGLPKQYKSMIPKTQILNQIIMKDLIYDEAVKDGYKLNKEEAKMLFESSLKKSGMKLDDFRSKLENESFAYDDFIDFYTEQNLINKYINDSVFSKIKLENGSAINYYNKNKEKFKIGEQIRASHILVNTSEKARNIISMLDNGSDFGDLAREKSIGPSAKNGGDLGYFGRGAMVPEFEKAAFAIKNIGDYTKEPVKTQFGYHVIMLNGRKEASQLTFEEAKSGIEKTLLNQKRSEKLKNYTDMLIKKADIKVYIKEKSQENGSEIKS